MRSILLLINKYFWRGYIGPIFAYLVPLVLTLFIGRITGPSLIIPGAFVIPTLCILLIFMPQSIFEFRNSSLIKRIGNTPIKPIKFLLAIGLFNTFIVISAFFFIFIWSFAIFYDSLDDKLITVKGTKILIPSFMYMIKHANWGEYIYSQLLLIVNSVLIGLIISAFAKSSLFIQACGISLMLVTIFVGPCVLPVSMVGKIDIVKYFGYLIPLKYPIANSIEAFTSGHLNLINNLNNSSIFNIDVNYVVSNIMVNDNSIPFTSLTIYDRADKILNLTMPYVFVIIFLYFVVISFRWGNRGKLNIRWNIFKELNNWIKLKQNKLNSSISSNPNSEYILEVNHLTKVFKLKHKNLLYANNDINFKIKKGRNLAILGANGAGKTVLTEIILGIDKPTSGSISYNYQFIKSFKEGLGIQFQDSIYPYGIKTKDVVKFFIKAYKIDFKNNELEEFMKIFGMDSYWNKNISSLSGGQKQRINLLLAILHKPKIVFLDELSTGLDIKIRNEIVKFVKSFAKKNNMTIIIVSHDMNEVKYLCDDVIILKEGQIVDKTTVQTICKKTKNLDDYLTQYL